MKKVGICLLLTLLMIASTFTVATAGYTPAGEEKHIDFTKDVSANGGEWGQSVEVENGDTVSFRLILTYYNATEPENEHYAQNITIKDTLPVGLEFVEGSATPFQPSENGNELTWYDPSIKLYHGENLTITFNAIVDSEVALINNAETTVDEWCTDKTFCAGDYAIVTIKECKPYIEVIKKVWNETSQQWEDNYLNYLKREDFIKYKITITYYNECNDYKLLNMIIKDDLPYCLKYHNTIEITTTGDVLNPPDIDFYDHNVWWNWTVKPQISLENGDSLTVIFDTEFIDYCDECSGENCVHVWAWGCAPPGEQAPIYDDRYCGATINCKEPPTTFEKTVFNKQTQNWVHNIETYYGSTLTFKLELVYNKKETLYNLHFTDTLPCILTYVTDSVKIDFANIFFEISEDGKTLWFNSTEGFKLEQGQTITITFDTKVTGSTADCGCGDTETVNNCADVWIWEECEPKEELGEDCVEIISHPNCPPSYPIINGPEFGKVGQEKQFTFYADDSDGDEIVYYITWGDGTDYTSELKAQGVEQVFSHKYNEPGNYQMNAKAIDIHGRESNWNPYGHNIIITGQESGPVSISIKRLGIGRIRVTIENTGEETLKDINWSMSFKRDKLLFGFNVTNNGTIGNLTEGKTAIIHTGPMFLGGSIGFLGLGRGNGKITIEVNGKEYTKTFKGWVFAKLVMITHIGSCS